MEILSGFLVLQFELVLRQIDHGVFLAYLHQHLLAVVGDLVIAHVAEHRFLAVFETVGAKMITTAVRAGVVIVAAIVRDGAPHVKDAVVNQAQVRVIRRRNIQRDQPIVNPIQVDLHRLLWLRVLVFVRLLLVVLLRVFAGFLVRLRFVFVLILLVGLLFVLLLFLANFVAPRSERVLSLLCQRHQIDALQVTINISKIRLVEERFEIATRRQHQILAVITEGRVIGRIPFVGDRRRLLVGHRIQINPVTAILFLDCVSDPLAVRRPIVAANFALFALHDLRHSFARHIQRAQPLLAIAPHQFLAIGGPDRGVEVGIGVAG